MAKEFTFLLFPNATSCWKFCPLQRYQRKNDHSECIFRSIKIFVSCKLNHFLQVLGSLLLKLHHRYCYCFNRKNKFFIFPLIRITVLYHVPYVTCGIPKDHFFHFFMHTTFWSSGHYYYETQNKKCERTTLAKPLHVEHNDVTVWIEYQIYESSRYKRVIYSKIFLSCN